jgi:hypothetical protein
MWLLVVVLLQATQQIPLCSFVAVLLSSLKFCPSSIGSLDYLPQVLEHCLCLGIVDFEVSKHYAIFYMSFTLFVVSFYAIYVQ